VDDFVVRSFSPDGAKRPNKARAENPDVRRRKFAAAVVFTRAIDGTGRSSAPLPHLTNQGARVAFLFFFFDFQRPSENPSSYMFITSVFATSQFLPNEYLFMTVPM